jgi:hypothetical protein
MQMQWVSCSASLPRDGDSIHFQLDDRKVPMDGTYTRGVFHSRWSEYDVSRVHFWSALNINSIVAAAPRAVSTIAAVLGSLQPAHQGEPT